MVVMEAPGAMSTFKLSAVRPVSTKSPVGASSRLAGGKTDKDGAKEERRGRMYCCRYQ